LNGEDCFQKYYEALIRKMEDKLLSGKNNQKLPRWSYQQGIDYRLEAFTRWPPAWWELQLHPANDLRKRKVDLIAPSRDVPEVRGFSRLLHLTIIQS
jgi:hypothetical protein